MGPHLVAFSRKSLGTRSHLHVKPSRNSQLSRNGVGRSYPMVVTGPNWQLRGYTLNLQEDRVKILKRLNCCHADPAVLRKSIMPRGWHRRTGPVLFGGLGVLPKYCLQHLLENQVVLPEYYLLLCQKMTIWKAPLAHTHPPPPPARTPMRGHILK